MSDKEKAYYKLLREAGMSKERAAFLAKMLIEKKPS
jgi:hypothetical protein